MTTVLENGVHDGRLESSPNGSADPEQLGLIPVADGFAPVAPTDLRAIGLEPGVVSHLALKTAYTVPQFTTEWAARQLHLPAHIVGEVLEQLRSDGMLEILGSSGPFGFRYAISGRGRESAARLMEISGYVGPAPVSLEDYTAIVEWQIARSPAVQPEHVSGSLSELILLEEDALLAGLAVSSGRSLFVFGPPGNGKSSVGRSIHSARRGDLWIPRCIGIGEIVIRVYDPHMHQAVDEGDQPVQGIDRRWVRIHRPLVVAGGEMALDSLDLNYSRTLRYYEAPLQLKANGGTFLLDDFGRQRVEPHELLNRLIIPLEHRIDYLTLHTGQKIQVPFLQMLIIATNLDPAHVTDPAFLRRMGYRLCLEAPSPERYRAIFERYASRLDLANQPGMVQRLLERYASEGRELRGCEPRDLIERARDICRFTDRPLELNDDVMALAWTGYFGTKTKPG
jgi:predicted ATPase with chaperone activity